MSERHIEPLTRRSVGSKQRLPSTFALALALVTVLPVTKLNADSTAPWEFDGGGWGHGVGLSQYGSQGMAEDGYSVDEIIDFYYSGADVETLGQIGAPTWLQDPESIFVNLSKSQSARTFEAIGDDIDVCHVGDGTDDCSTPDLTLSDGQVLTISVSSAGPLRCERSVDGGLVTEGSCWVNLTWEEDVQDRRVKYGPQEYARGTLRVRPSNVDPQIAQSFHVVVSLDLEDYIYGIAETLLHWDPAALETQAVIARSYGASKSVERANADGTLPTSRRNECWCHLSASPGTDQNYDGWDTDNEGSSTFGQKWRDAVDHTQDQVVTHPQVVAGNTIVSTFYSSSNGGASENNEDVWGGSAQPHLRSVVDPWSADPDVNPLATWTIWVDDDDMATVLGWDYVLDAFVQAGPPGLIVNFTGIDNGSPVSELLDGTEIRSILNTYGYKEGGGSVRVSPYITLVTDPPGFDDIVGHLFQSDIEWLGAQEITKGCNPPDDTLFCPEDPVSREVMAAFLNRYLDLPAPSQDYFTDDENSIFEDDINRLAEAGITTGCGGTKFCPKNVVDRGQMAAFLVRALGLTDNGGGDLFIDDNNSIFENDIDRLGAAEITKGCNPPVNDRYCPDLAVSRGAMAAFLHRADDL